jgi:integrase/recombinase XerD
MHTDIQDWLNWLSLNASPRTLEAYGWELHKLSAAMPHLTPNQFKESHLTQYLAQRRMFDGVGDSAIKRSVAAFKSFFGWCRKKSPALGLRYPTVKKKIQRTLDYEELCRVMAICDTSTDKGKRDLAMICLFADSGIRVSELCHLQLARLDLPGLYLIVQIKGGNEDYGFFTAYTAAQLNAWLSVRHKYARPEADTVFVSLMPRRDKRGQPLTREGVKCELRKIGARAGVPGLSPHVFRRSGATIATNNGANSRLVQLAFRWTDYQTFMQYTRAANGARIRPFLATAGFMGQSNP